MIKVKAVSGNETVSKIQDVGSFCGVDFAKSSFDDK